MYKIAESKIHGKGIISTTYIPKNKIIGKAIVVNVTPYTQKESKYGCFLIENEPVFFEITGHLGIWINHQPKKLCNSKLVRQGNVYFLVATKEILPQEEISSDYKDTPFFIKKHP